LRQGFEVDGTRDVAVELDEKGDPPKIPPDPQPKLSIEASNVAASITLINCRFDKVLQSTGFYGGRQAAGVYKIRVQYGQEIADVSERIILLDRDADQLTIAGPMVRSPVPTRGTAFIHEFHELAADRLADLPAPPGRPAAETCGLAVLARYWTGNPPTVTDPSRFPHPFDGLSLHTLKGAPIADLASDSGTALVSSNGLDPVATLQLPLDTGTYILRQSLPDGRTIDRSVVLAPGWVTEVYIQRSNDDLVPSEAARVRSMGSVRLLMRRPGTHISSAGVGNDNEALEIAYQALGSGKRLLTQTGAGSLEALLLAKFENPIAGIVGALLLISECDQSPDPVQRDRCLAPLDETVRNLRRLVGSSHPDVEALSIRCPDPTLHSSSPVMVPPMFSRSWAAAVHSAAGHRTLAGPVWNRIKAKVSDPLYLVWSSDERTRAVYEQSLTESVRSTFAAAAAPRRGRLRARASAPAAGAPSFELEMALPAADAALAEAVATFERLQVPIAEIERMAATKAHQDEPELSQEPRHEPE